MQALISAMWAIASLFGPAFGALMVDYFSWRYAFLINVPCALLIAILTALYLRHLPYPKVHTRFDFWGASVFTVAALALLFSLIQIGQLQFSVLEFILMVVSLILFTYLIKREKKLERGPLCR